MREMLNVFLQSLQNPAACQASYQEDGNSRRCRLRGTTSFSEDYSTTYTVEDERDTFSDDLQEAIELENLTSVPDYMCPLLG